MLDIIGGVLGVAGVVKLDQCLCFFFNGHLLESNCNDVFMNI